MAPRIASLIERAPVTTARRSTSSRPASLAAKTKVSLIGCSGFAGQVPRRRFVFMAILYTVTQSITMTFKKLFAIVCRSVLLFFGVLFGLTVHHLRADCRALLDALPKFLGRGGIAISHELSQFVELIVGKPR
jgi:hypothetical protein